MERIEQRQLSAFQALTAFFEALSMEKSTVIRDACILRFQLAFEATWKYAQAYLKQEDGIEVASPRKVVRSCFEAGYLSENITEICLEMIDDRNLVVHTYDQELAEAIYEDLPRFAEALKTWLAALK